MNRDRCRQLDRIKHYGANRECVRGWREALVTTTTEHQAKLMKTGLTLTMISMEMDGLRGQTLKDVELYVELYVNHKGVKYQANTKQIHMESYKKRVASSRRCHACNIKETPEWRRGPDGAGTLCDACGIRKSTTMVSVFSCADILL